MSQINSFQILEEVRGTLSMKRQKRNPNDRAFHKGYVAAMEGRNNDSCPHENGSLHQEWVNGWRQGRQDYWSGFGRAAIAQRMANM